MGICGFDLLTPHFAWQARWWLDNGHLDIDFGTWKCLCIQECQLYCPVYISVERWIYHLTKCSINCMIAMVFYIFALWKFSKANGQGHAGLLLDLMLYRSSPQSQVSLEWKSSKEPPPSFSSSVSLEQSHHLSHQLSSCILVLLCWQNHRHLSRHPWSLATF